ncbi:MAG: MOSC domain-containing protein [Bacteroidetes bacterium]|nr:MOSC domain-containing protein [Bacteroidota bacterium]MCW5895152.1 MOSC domain-containing protein [Bacteroidota bacterium]
MSMRLSELNIYPIKSCGLISLHEADLEPRGLRHDRRWLVVDDGGMFMTQRDFPRMTLVSVQVKSDCLFVQAPEMEPLLVPFKPDRREHLPVVIWDDSLEAMPVDGKTAEWFSEFLGVRCKLVVMTERSVRPVDKNYDTGENVVSFADGFPMLLISEASLADLNERLEVPVPMKRFRPNLVVDGCEPFAEDTWKEIVIGGVHMYVVKPCARCTITTVDTATGTKGQEPLRTLATFRSVGNQVMFGQNVIHAAPGRIRVGDEVRVIR